MNYVDSLDLDTILNFYSVTDGGYFQSRPGRDDHYFFTKNRLCSSQDKYLNQLTKLGSELTDYYSCQGRDDGDFCILNLADTEQLKTEINKKYDKNNHVLFLISELINSIRKSNEILKNALEILSTYSIRKGDEFIFNQSFSSLEQWKDFIASQNEFWYNS